MPPKKFMSQCMFFHRHLLLHHLPTLSPSALSPDLALSPSPSFAHHHPLHPPRSTHPNLSHLFRSPEKSSFSNAASSSPYRERHHSVVCNTQSLSGRRRRSRRHLSSMRERVHVPQKVRPLLNPHPFSILYSLFSAIRQPPSERGQASSQDKIHVTPKSQRSQAARDSLNIHRRSSRFRRPTCIFLQSSSSCRRRRRTRPQAQGPTSKGPCRQAKHQEKTSCRRHGIQGQRHDRDLRDCPQSLPASATGSEHVIGRSERQHAFRLPHLRSCCKRVNSLELIRVV